MTDIPADDPARARVLVTGRVQGVGYRAFTRHAAVRRGLVGGVRNLDSGQVEAEVEGGKRAIEDLIRELKIGPPGAHVRQVQVEWAPVARRFTDFQIWY